MATNSKMFVHYSGTKASFIAAGLASQYTNKIVFIKGGENGTGACVYTHGAYYANVEEALAALKYFSKISANGVTAEASAPNGVINFSADDPASVEVKVDSNGVHFGLTEEFKAAVNVTLPKRIKDIEDDYLTSEDKQGLEQGIADALTEAKGYTDSEVSRIVADSGSGLIGQEGDASSANTIYGAKKYADEKASAAETAAKSYADEKASAVQGKLDEEIARAKAAEEANASAIATEKGRLDAFLASAEIGDKAIDTLKEIQDYITTDGAAAEAMTAAIAAAQSAADNAQGEVDALETVVAEEVNRAKAAEGVNAKAIADEADRAKAAEKVNADAISALSETHATDKAALEKAIADEQARAEGIESGLNTRLAAVEGDYLKNADKEALNGLISTAQAKADAAAPQATTYNKTEVDGLVNGVDAKLADYYKKSETYTKAEVDAMWEWEEL